MKKVAIIVMMLVVLPFIVQAADVKINGYVRVTFVEYACKGEVRLYDAETGGSLIDYTCVSANGYFSFNFESLDTGYYYLEVWSCLPCEATSGTGDNCKTRLRAEIHVTGTGSYYKLLMANYGTENTTECPDGCN